MDMSQTITLSALAGLLALYFGGSAWLRSHDAKVKAGGAWEGEVNTKLDTIITNISKSDTLIVAVNNRLDAYAARLATVENIAAESIAMQHLPAKTRTRKVVE